MASAQEFNTNETEFFSLRHSLLIYAVSGISTNTVCFYYCESVVGDDKMWINVNAKCNFQNIKKMFVLVFGFKNRTNHLNLN